MLDRLDETVVAVSSAPGSGAAGIVRLTGPQAIEITDRLAVVAKPPPLKDRPGSTRISVELRIDGGTLPAWIYLFRAPRSYTRQDLIEIYTVGSPLVLELIRRAAVALGARPAEPGEFTARAFLNGAMDLASAEGVAALIRAQSDSQWRAARRMMDGALAARIGAVRNGLAELLALVEADIDFAEEPIEFITPPALKSRLDAVAGELAALAGDAQSTEPFDVLPHILLFGPPNAGKSSLMNALSGTSRAICAAVAGTTRDVLSAPIRIGRGEAILLDAAGVDDSEDEIIAQARAMVLSTAERVDLLCVVLDAATVVSGENGARTRSGMPNDMSRPAGPFDLDPFLAVVRSLQAPRTVVAVNKCDLIDPQQGETIAAELQASGFSPVCLTSALSGDGLDALRDVFSRALGVAETTVLGEAVILTERQAAAIADAFDSLHRAAGLAESATETIDCADVLAFELREALDALGSVTGAVTAEDLLTSVFANFCIGK